MNKAYNPIDWKNEPNTSTPINETNLNKMDRAIDTIDNRVIDLDNGKVNKEEGKSLVSNTDISKIGANETAIQTHISNKSNPHSVTKAQVGLGNVNNTSDADKPISTAQQAEFDAIKSNLAQLEYGENAGGKNLLKPTLQTTTVNGVTCTNNGDGTFTLNGTATANTSFQLFSIMPFPYQTGNYKMLGCQSGGTSTTYRMWIGQRNAEDDSWLGLNAYDYGSGVVNNLIKGNKYRVEIDVKSGTTFSNLVFKPMITEDLSATYDDFKPYIPSVKMLADKSAQIDDNNMLGYVVPSECPIKNYVDSDGVFHQRVKRIDLGSISWNYHSDSGNMYADGVVSDRKMIGDTLTKSYCNKYAIYGKNLGNVSMLTEDKSIGMQSSAPSRLVIRDTSYTDATTFKNAMKGVYLYYELATEKTISVDGNEAVTKVNESLSDYGLDGIHNIEMLQGYPSENDITVTYNNSNYVCSKNAYECNGDDKIVVKNKYTNGLVYFYDSSKAYISGSEFPCTAPTNAKYFRFRIGYVENITPQTVGKISVYINNAIDEIKSDLSAVQSNTILNYESTTVDLNSLTGHPLIASVNTGATNAPTGFGGGYMIVVYAGSSSAALYQTLVDVVKNKTYRRSLYHGSWSDWSLTAN